MKRIVVIHSVSENYYTASRLKRYIRTMRKLGFNFVSLEHIVSIENNIRNEICITFDDGYKSVIENALPILKEENVPATLFIPTGLLNKKKNDEELLNNACYKNEETMSFLDIDKWIKEGMSIGFHTCKHIDLSKSNIKDIYEDFKRGVELMKQHNLSTKYFAYPLGFLPPKKYRTEFEKLLTLYNFEYAFTVKWGNVFAKNRFYINRIILGDFENFYWSILKSIGCVDWYFSYLIKRAEQIP